MQIDQRLVYLRHDMRIKVGLHFLKFARKHTDAKMKRTDRRIEPLRVGLTPHEYNKIYALRFDGINVVYGKWKDLWRQSLIGEWDKATLAVAWQDGFPIIDDVIYCASDIGSGVELEHAAICRLLTQASVQKFLLFRTPLGARMIARLSLLKRKELTERGKLKQISMGPVGHVIYFMWMILLPIKTNQHSDRALFDLCTRFYMRNGN